MNSAAAVAQMLKRPDLPLVMNQLQQQLNAEAKRRHAFREWLDEDKKAEFINGEIIMHSPVKRRHLKASGNLSTMLGIYVRLNDPGEILVEKALIGLTRNDYEPDISFFSLKQTATFTDDQMVFPAPDFVVEILSKSTAKNDRGIKLIDYAAHGVREYWIVDPEKQQVEQYLLIGEDTEFMPANKHLIGQSIASKVIEGFEIPVEAIFDEALCVETLKWFHKDQA